jgi:hypothetical protein
LAAGFGEIPKPTVQSGWEKMEVRTFKKWQTLNVSLSMLLFLPHLFFRCREFLVSGMFLNLSSFRRMDREKERGI